MGRQADDEADKSDEVWRTIMAVTFDGQDVESVAAMAHDMDALLDEVRTVFPYNAAILAITDDLRRRLRAALWASIDRTLQ